VPPLRLVYEFVPGQLMHFFCESAEIPLAEKERVLGELAREWGRRHALAIALREPRLVQSHATLCARDPDAAGARRTRALRHLRLRGGVGAPLRAAAAREPRARAVLDSLGRRAPPEQLAPLVAALVRAYPDRAQLERLPRDMRDGRFPLFAPLARLGLWWRGARAGAQARADRAPGGGAAMTSRLRVKWRRHWLRLRTALRRPAVARGRARVAAGALPRRRAAARARHLRGDGRRGSRRGCGRSAARRGVQCVDRLESVQPLRPGDHVLVYGAHRYAPWRPPAGVAADRL
jgi:hypothetical protein